MSSWIGSTIATLNRLLGTSFTLSPPGETGSGAIVRATSPVLVTPDLGAPSALVLTNATGLPAAERLKEAVLPFTRAMNGADGAVDYTGAGFTPKFAMVVGSDATAAGTIVLGSFDGTTQRCFHNTSSPAQDSVFFFAGSGGNDQQGTASFVSDGVRITYTKTGAPGGTFTGHIVCLG